METRPHLRLRTERHYTSRRYRSFFSTSTSSTWSKWSSCRHHNKSSRLAGLKNNGWMVLTRCELWQEASGELSVPRPTSTQERRSSRRCEVFSMLRLPTEIQWVSESVSMHSINRQCLAIQKTSVCGASACGKGGPFQSLALQDGLSRSQDFAPGLGHSQHEEYQRHRF